VRKIAVVTVGRSDYGIYRPILRRIQADHELQLCLIVGGMHLSPEFGLTSKLIEEDGFEIHDRVEMLLSSDSSEGISKSVGLGVIGFSQSYARARPDILVVLGDRFEMYAAALAALPFKIPVAHIHGGELTRGAIDDALRHSMTKLSHLHFVATQEYANRVIQLGEDPRHVIISGAPGLDNLYSEKLLKREELSSIFSLQICESPYLIVTYHPVTLEFEQTESQISEILAALESTEKAVVFTMPNADTSGRIIREKILEYVGRQPNCQAVEYLGTQGYFSVMKFASAMVGNSSSGIIEAASFDLPVVNIGTRQAGRVRGQNVIDVDYSQESIIAGIRKASDSQFRKDIQGLPNPYGDGTASELIVKTLKSVKLGDDILIKRFYDLELRV